MILEHIEAYPSWLIVVVVATISYWSIPFCFPSKIYYPYVNSSKQCNASFQRPQLVALHYYRINKLGVSALLSYAHTKSKVSIKNIGSGGLIVCLLFLFDNNDTAFYPLSYVQICVFAFLRQKFLCSDQLGKIRLLKLNCNKNISKLFFKVTGLW